MRPLLQWFIATDRGRVREANEDSVLSFPNTEDLERQPELEPLGGRLCVVADGMGGHRGGREASSMAVRRIGQFYYNQQGQRPDDALMEAIQQTSRDILLLGQRDPSLERMGSTVVLVATEGAVAYIANVGDSRAYHWRGGQLKLISVDDRWVAAQVREGMLTEEQAQSHTYRNVLTQHLGSQEPIEPHIAHLALQLGDWLLLCTDGLFELVSDEEIQRLLGAERPERVPKLMVDLALRRGAPDNVTVAVGYYGPLRPRGLSPLLRWLGLGAALLAVLALVVTAAFALVTQERAVVSGESASPAVIVLATGAPLSTAQSTATRPAKPTSTTMPATATPEPLPLPTATITNTPEQFGRTSGISVTVVNDPNQLTPEEQEVHTVCTNKSISYLPQASVIVARDSNLDESITFSFSTTPSEPQQILSGKKVREPGQYQCAWIWAGKGEVTVSADPYLSKEYTFETGKIYLVKYYP